jgi:hypothetical protein
MNVAVEALASVGLVAARACSQDAAECRHLRQIEKDADRQSRDLDRMMKTTFGK